MPGKGFQVDNVIEGNKLRKPPRTGKRKAVKTHGGVRKRKRT